MALVKLGGLAQDVRGTLNGNVFSRNKGGAYVRSKVSACQPVSSWSSLVRECFKASAQRWAQSLNDGQRADWEAFAAVHPFVNVFGDTIMLSGIAMYEAVNQRLRLCGCAWVDDAPQTFIVDDLGEITVAVSATVGHSLAAMITVENPTPYGGGLYVFTTPPLLGSAKPQKNMYRLINLANKVLLSSAVDFGAEMQDRFPDQVWSSGQKINMLIAGIDGLTGAIGPGRSVPVTIVPHS
jgi:hypothetical protein